MTDTASQAPSEPFKFVVYRDKWLRGDPFNSAMLDANGGRCCLGFYCKALGIADEHQIDMLTPRKVARDSGLALPEWLVVPDGSISFRNSMIAESLMTLNDSSSLTDAEREATIVEIFAEHGVVVEFRDGTGEEASL